MQEPLNITPRTITVREWFRMARAEAFNSVVDWNEVTIRFATGHHGYVGVEVDIRNLNDVQTLIDTPPVLQMARYYRIVGIFESYESRVRREELVRGLMGRGILE